MTVTFTFEGEAVEALPGDTIAAALLRAGVTTFSRGPKYHRPRGPFCLAGTCAQCHMRVDGEPNVPTCQTPAAAGMVVERQNVLGSGDHDLLRAIDFFYPEKLDPHHLMTRFRALSAATQAIARRLAGVGERPTKTLSVTPAEESETDAVVVGGGRAGIRAANALGGEVVLLEGRRELGGRGTQGYAPAVLPALNARVHVRLATRAIGVFEEGGARYVVARERGRLLRVRCGEVVVATGGVERNLLFEANDLPGVVGGRGLLRLVREHRVWRDKRVVVVGSSPDALVVARGLSAEGLAVEALVDLTGELERTSDLEILRGFAPTRAHGRASVTSLYVAAPDGRQLHLPCDLVAIVAPLQPAYELAAEVGAETRFDAAAGGFVVKADAEGRTSVPWLRAVGWAAGRAEPATGTNPSS